MRFNYRFLSDLIIASVVLTGVTLYAHRYQIRRTGDLMLKLARQERDAGNIGESATLYMRYLKLVPKSSEAAAELGELAARSGNEEGTYYQLTRSLRLNPAQSEIREQVAEMAVQKKQYAEAKQFLLGETNREYREKPRRQWLLGVAEAQLGEFDIARGYMETAVEAVPNDPDFAKSLAYLLTDRFSDAKRGKQVLDRLVTEAPENPAVYMTRSRWSFDLASKTADRKLAEPLLSAAWDDLQQSLRLDPENPELALLAAEIAIAQGTPLQAREIVTKAIEANPKRADLYHVIVRIESAANNRDQAIQWLDQGLVELPEDADLLWTLAELQFDAGNIDVVQDIVKQLRSQNHPEGPLRLIEAKMLANNGKFRESVDLLEKSTSLLDQDKDQLKQADYLQASCYRSLGDSDQQLAALRRVIALDPQWMSAREELAQALLQRGRLRDSMSEYMLVIDRPNPSVDAQVSFARLLFLEGLRKAANTRNWDRLQKLLSTLETIPEAATKVAVLRAELLVAQGQPQEAESLLRSQIENDNESLLASQTLIEMLIEKQDWDQVESVVQLAEDASGDSPALRVQKARYLIERFGDQAFEEPQFSQLAEPQPDWDEVQRGNLAVSFATLYLQIKDYANSEKLARTVTELQSYQPKLNYYVLLFDLALSSGNAESMNTALAQVRQFDATRPLLQIGEGLQLAIQARELPETSTTERDSLYEQSIAKLTEAAVARPTWSRIPRLKAEIYDRWGRSELAATNYLDAITLGETDGDLISRTAVLLFEQQQFREADVALRKLQEQNSSLSYELTRLASQVSLQLKDYDRALGLAQQCLEESGKAEDHTLLAEIYRSSGDFAAAEQEFQNAIDIDPANPDSWVSLVQTLADQTNVDKARQIIDDARQSLPTEVMDDTLGRCFQALKDFAQAEKYYLQALQATPNSPPQVRRLADFYVSINNASKAEPLLKQLSQDPSESKLETSEDDRSWARRKLALIYGLQPGAKNLKRAEDLIAANTQQGEPSPDDQQVLAIIYGNRSDNPSRKKAIAILQQVISQQSEYSLEDNFILAELLYRTGNWEGYRRTMQRVLDSGGSKNPICVRYHAAALLEEGEFVEAKSWVERLNSMAPGQGTTNAVILDWLFGSQNYAGLLDAINSIAKDQANWGWAAGFAEKYGTKLLQQGDASQAEPFLTLASNLFGQVTEAAAESEGKYSLTAFQVRQGQFEQAFERLSDPEISPDTLAQISQMALRSGQLSDQQTQRFLALTSEALQRHPDHELLSLSVADLHFWVGSWKQATEAYKALITAHPDSVAALNNMAMMFAMSGQRLDVAIRAVDRAIANVGAIDTLLDTRGLIHLASGSLELAEQDFRASIESSDSADRLFHLAQALHAQNKIDDARSIFEQAVDEGLSEQRLHRQERVAYQQLASEL